MAPCRFRKHQGVAAGGLALLAALVVVGLALSGGAAAQQKDQNVVIPDSVDKACREGQSPRLDLLLCASGTEKDIERCCGDVTERAATGDDCACGVLKVIKGRGIDPNICDTTGIEDVC